jgi:hypothetical protein
MDPASAVTFASLLTPTGVLVAAGFLTGIVALVKASLPTIDRHVSGATLSFLLSLALYVIIAIETAHDGNGYLQAAFAWVGCATSAIGINAASNHLGNLRDGVAGVKPIIKPISHTDADQSDLVEAAANDAGVAESTADALPTEEPLPTEG